MGFGDWPGWIALAAAIISPVITVWLNNHHQMKMEKLKITAEWEKSKSVLLSELQTIGATKIKDYTGFSPEAMMALLFADKSIVETMEELNHTLMIAKTFNIKQERPVSAIERFGKDENGHSYTYSKFAKSVALQIINSKSVIVPKRTQSKKKGKQ